MRMEKEGDPCDKKKPGLHTLSWTVRVHPLLPPSFLHFNEPTFQGPCFLPNWFHLNSARLRTPTYTLEQHLDRSGPPAVMLTQRTSASRPDKSHDVAATLAKAASSRASTTITPTAADFARTQSRILQLSLAVRIAAVFALLCCASIQQAFDTSHELLSYSLDPDTLHGLSAGPFRWVRAFVRWDTIYFLSAAAPSGGYVWEQTLAFQPGIVALLRVLGYVTPSLDGSWSPTSALILATLAGNLAATVSPVLLYRLTWRVTRHAELAATAAVLSTFAPSGGSTLAAPTPESFFSCASLAGLLVLESARGKGIGWGKIVKASVWFAVATAFRTNGIMLVGYVVFKLLQGRDWAAVLKVVVAAVVCVLPSAAFQLWAYGRFCSTQEGRPWCEARLPSVYSFVQSHYWHVGWLRYWELAQLPNFALAAPVLLLIAYTARTFYRASSWKQLMFSLNPLTTSATTIPNENSHNPEHGKGDAVGLTLGSTPQAVPYVVHGVVLGALLLFASHVQIALRFATPGGMPMVWWGAAHAVLYAKPWLRRSIVAWLSLQSCAALVLYAGFYPPA